MLHRTLALHVGNVLLESLLLDPEGLEDAQHLHHGVVVLTLTTGFDCAIGTGTLNFVNFGHFHGLGLGCLLHHGLSHHELRQHLLFGILSPSEPCFAQVAVLEGKEELVGRGDSLVVEVLLASGCPDALEDLTAEGDASNGSDHVNCGFFFADVRHPLQEDVF